MTIVIKNPHARGELLIGGLEGMAEWTERSILESPTACLMWELGWTYFIEFDKNPFWQD